jgi:hypothetical protein
LEKYYTLASVLRRLDNLKSEIETLVLDLLNPPDKIPSEAGLPLTTEQQTQMFSDQIFFMPHLAQQQSRETQQVSPFNMQELQRLTACQIVASEQGYQAHREETNGTWQELLSDLDYSDI